MSEQQIQKVSSDAAGACRVMGVGRIGADALLPADAGVQSASHRNYFDE